VVSGQLQETRDTLLDRRTTDTHRKRNTLGWLNRPLTAYN
jgi:hypothetical protein